jgi:Flp pilus assembly protein TadD
MDMYQAHLDYLFDRLRQAGTQTEIDALQEEIWVVWLHTDDPTLEGLMATGLQALEARQFDDAIEFFSQMIRRNPQYPEAWNKRATAYYLRGNFKAAIEDIMETLALEPRHFGALAGLASIYLETMLPRRAKYTLEALAEVMPEDQKLKERILELEMQIKSR